MDCPRCGAESHVLHTDKTPAGVSRRRECLNLHRFTTYEVMPGVLDKRQLARAERGFLKRAEAWRRDQAVLTSEDSASALARRLGITEARVRQLRAKHRPQEKDLLRWEKKKPWRLIALPWG